MKKQSCLIEHNYLFGGYFFEDNSFLIVAMKNYQEILIRMPLSDFDEFFYDSVRCWSGHGQPLPVSQNNFRLLKN
jgi:hypothetical protein